MKLYILFCIVISSFIISLGALMGAVTLALKREVLDKILLFLVALSAGVLMGGAFLHLLPEAAKQLSGHTAYGITLFSFVFFFFIEKLFHWRHCHNGICNVHSFGYMNLFGDSIHNFIDGLIISASFLTNIHLGFATTFAVALHEIPQEIGDFGVLLYAGFEKRKAIILNYLVATTTILGGIVGYLLSFFSQSFVSYLLPVAAGGFIYISASDLMPEIRKEESLRKSLISFGLFIIGVIIMSLD